MPLGSITDQDTDFVETWENVASQQNAIWKLDRRGDERQEVVAGRRTFMLTTQDRIITQDKILERKDDPFLNGSFRPIIVPDNITVETNPNAVSDDEIMKMFSVGDVAWEGILETIDSVGTLRRMLDLADEAEALTLKRYRQVEARLVTVRPSNRITSNDPQLQRFLSDRPNQGGGAAPEAADGRANPRRSIGGGRSSDYR